MNELAELLITDQRLAAAIVFGSAARDALRPDSDLDLAVLYTDVNARASAERDVLGRLGELGSAAGRDVHLIDLGLADPGLKRAIFNTGQKLFDRSNGKLRALECSSLVAYFDNEYLRRLIDEGHRRRLEKTRG